MIIPWKPSKNNFVYVTDVPFVHDDKTSLDYYFQKAGDTLICCFQPSREDRDWESNFDYLPKTFDIYPGSKIKVHEGLAKQYLGARDKFLDMCYDPDVKRILIGGYSLGGGIAQLACEDAAYHVPNKEILSISYEGPRVFAPSKAVKKLLQGRQTLIKTGWDIVCHVPFKLFINPGLRIRKINPIKLGWGWPSITFWADYGKKIWIGKWNKVYPFQHTSEQIEQNLFNKFGE